MKSRLVWQKVSFTALLVLLSTPAVRADRTAAARVQGFQLYDAGRFQEAVAELDRVLQRHPRDLEALVKRGNCYLRLNQPERALPDFDRASHFDPLLPGAATGRGIALLMVGRNEDAAAAFQRAVQTWKKASSADHSSIFEGLLPVPNLAGGASSQKTGQIVQGHATAHSGLGQAYHRLGQDDLAITEYDRAIEIYALDPSAYIGRADCRVALGDYHEALADYNEAIRLGPSYSRAYSRRGKLYEALGRTELASADYDRAIELDPADTFTLRLRAAMHSGRGENDRAIEDVAAAARIRPDDAGGLKDWGGVLVRMGQYQQAIQTLNRAVALDPNKAAIFLNRGAAYNGLGQYERALEDLNKAIALDPKSPGARTNVGLAYYMIGQYDRAIEELSEAVRLAPTNATVRLNRGNVYARLGFTEQAQNDYAEASHLDSRLIASYGGPARLLEEMGRNKLAIRDEKNLASRPEPADPDRLMDEGNALRTQGDWNSAIARFSAVIAADPQRAGAYVARGWARFCAGQPGATTDSRSFLDGRGWRDRLSLYMALLGFLDARRSGKQSAAAAFLDEAIASADMSKWPAPVLRFFRSDLSAEDLLTAAATDIQRTEAHAFIALDLIEKHNGRAARDHLIWVRDKGSARSIATDVARAELERIDHPPEALSRMIDEMLNR
jgi:tetratricopeptide (TPR) repeat protein